eukprot:COSAG01_NODE_10834_length_2071_cov_16.713489_1_plen_637_part_10
MFLFLECSGGRRGDTSYFTSPVFSNMKTMTFWYHMAGSAMGSLSVEAYGTSRKWQRLWLKSGPQQSAQTSSWLQAAVSLPAGTSQVRFVGRRGPNWSSDMAIDDVMFSLAPATPPPPAAEVLISLPVPPLEINDLVRVVTLDSCCRKVTGTTPLRWTAGESYYIKALLKAGGGSNYVKVGMTVRTDRDSAGDASGKEYSPIPISLFDCVVPVQQTMPQPPTPTCDFDGALGMCGWTESGNNHWMRGSTTPSAGTGGNKAQSGQHFMFLETNHGCPGSASYLISPTLSPLMRSMKFFYHMHGASMGTLSVEALVTRSVKLHASNYGQYLRVSSASAAGSSRSSWELHEVRCDTANGTRLQLQLDSASTSPLMAQNALDGSNLTWWAGVGSSRCAGARLAHGCQWLILKLPEPASSVICTITQHFTDSSNALSAVSIEASSDKKHWTMPVTQPLGLGDTTFAVSGEGISHWHGWISAGWTLTGQQHTQQHHSWTAAELEVPARTAQVRFKGIRGSSSTGDMAIDTVRFSSRVYIPPRPLGNFASPPRFPATQYAHLSCDFDGETACDGWSYDDGVATRPSPCTGTRPSPGTGAGKGRPIGQGRRRMLLAPAPEVSAKLCTDYPGVGVNVECKNPPVVLP